jgi:hypothetical protein
VNDKKLRPVELTVSKVTDNKGHNYFDLGESSLKDALGDMKKLRKSNIERGGQGGECVVF